jgi:hypothetical protein
MKDEYPLLLRPKHGGNPPLTAIAGAAQGYLNNQLYISGNSSGTVSDSSKTPPRVGACHDLTLNQTGCGKRCRSFGSSHKSYGIAAKARQRALDQEKRHSWFTKKRPQYLLSGPCWSAVNAPADYSKVNYERYGCSTARNKGECVCGNRLTIKADVLEDAVLSGHISCVMN